MRSGKIWLLVLICGLCFGRENPFVPSSELNSSITTSNVVENLPPFEKQNFKFPSDARNFISVTLKYQAVDGSIKEKVVDVNKSVFWQDELVLSKLAMPVVVEKPDVSVTKEEPKIIDVIVKENAPKDGERNMTEPLKEVVIKPLEKPEPLKSFEFKKAKFEVYAMQMKITTKDTKMKEFLIDKSSKIVLDMNATSNFNTKKIKLDCGAFKSVTFGSHDKFYRLVINLDGSYKYDMQTLEDGYLIKLRK